MPKTVLILSNHFITLYNFRRELIATLLERGHRVCISMPDSERNEYFEKLGCEIIATPMSRRGMNPIEDIKLLRDYMRIMKSLKPDIVLSYTIKPNIYGSIASRRLGLKQICNITGTGATFLKESILSRVVRTLYRISIPYSYKVFFQNTGDRDYFVKHKMLRDNYDVIPGSGVNLDAFRLTELPKGETVSFIFIGRIMAVKGIEQYLDCAKAIRGQHPESRFYIAGFIEEERYKPLIEQYAQEGWIEYLGFCQNIGERIKACHCTVLPSHGGEGVPNVLLESAATGRACIATRINGSSDVVEDSVTGYLYQPGSSEELIACAEKYLSLSHAQRRTMGIKAREKIEREFDRQIVIDKYIQEVER